MYKSPFVKLIVAVSLLLFFSNQARAAFGFETIDMLEVGSGNASVSQIGGGFTPGEFPFGSNTFLGGVPFNITEANGQLWSAYFAAGGNGSGVISQTFPLAVTDIHGFYTVASTYWGLAGTYTSLTFNFDDATSYTANLTNGVDLRDFNKTTPTYSNTINGTTTQEVYNDSTTITRLDRQFFDLDAAGFGGKNLINFTVTDTGAAGVSRVFLVGATAQTGVGGQIVPEPSTYVLVGVGIGFFLISRRRQSHS